MSLMDVTEAAEYLRITPKAVHRLCKRGKLGYVQIDDRGSRRFLKEHLDAYIESNLVPARKLIDKRPGKPVSSPSKGGRETAGQQEKGLLRKEIQTLCRS
jgi:excisionase family DNA binding protein